ncbi:unnamed protein product, partial [Brenthis ino]
MADDFNAALMKNRFYEQLEYYRRSNPPKEVVSISDKRYQQILEDIPKARASLEKTAHEFWLLKTYDILNVKGVNKLIYPNSSPALLYLSDGELFNAVHENPYKALFGDTIKLGLEMQNSCSLLVEEDLERFLGVENKYEKRIRNKHTLSTLETITSPGLESNVNISESVESNINGVIASEPLFDQITCSDSKLETLVVTEPLIKSLDDSKSANDTFCTTEMLINNISTSELATNYYSKHLSMVRVYTNVSSIEFTMDMYSPPESIMMATSVSEPIFDNIVISDSDINTSNNSLQSLINSFTILERSQQLQPTNLQITQVMNFPPSEPAHVIFPNSDPIYNNISTLDSITNTLMPLESIIDFYPTKTTNGIITFTNSKTIFNTISIPHAMTTLPSTNTSIDTSFEANIDTYSQSFIKNVSSPEKEFTYNIPTQITISETIPSHTFTDIFTNNFPNSDSEPIIITIPGIEPNLNNISFTESTINTNGESNINMIPMSKTTVIPLPDS